VLTHTDEDISTAQEAYKFNGFDIHNIASIVNSKEKRRINTHLMDIDNMIILGIKRGNKIKC
jgi:hypothetical protein